MRKKITKIFIPLTFVLFACLLYGDLQTELNDSTLQSIYKLKSGESISSINLRNLFLKLINSSWTVKPDGTLFYNRGTVGIGTQEPSNFSMLEIHAPGDNSKSVFGMLKLIKENDGGEASIGFLDSGDSSNETKWVIGRNVGGFNNDTFTFFRNTHLLVIHPNGNIGIGTTDPQHKLDVAGNLNVSGNITYTGTLTHTSDVRFKKSISPLDNALEKVLSLNGVSYQWKTEELKSKNFPQGKNYGFIAQDMEKIIPELVLTGKDGYKSIAYANLTVFIIEAFKEYKTKNDAINKDLSQKIEHLQSKINKLEEMNLKLLQKLESFESKMQGFQVNPGRLK